MTIYQPYTYLIGWTTYNKWYYGVRYAKKCHPNELWVSYFTSSREVLKFRKTYGEPDIVQTRKTFLTKEDATLWEHRVLKRLKVNINEKWLNKTYNGCFEFKGPKNTIPGMLAAKEKSKGKTYEEIFNDVSKIENKKKNSSITSKNNWKNPELKIKMSMKCVKTNDTSNYKKSALKRWSDPVDSEKRKNNMKKPKSKVVCCLCCKREMTLGGLQRHLK